MEPLTLEGLHRTQQKQEIQLRLLETELKDLRARYEKTLRELEPVIDFTPELSEGLAHELKIDPELKPIELPSRIGIAEEPNEKR